MSKTDELYWAYVNWSLKIGVPPLDPIQYEKVLRSIQDVYPNQDKMPRKKG